MSYLRKLVVVILLLFVSQQIVKASNIEVLDSYDLKTALDYAFSSNIDTILLVTSGGVYTTTDTLHLAILEPVVIMAKPGLAEKPIITNSDPNAQVGDILRIYDDCVLEGIIFDGSHDQSHGIKYSLRFENDETRGYTVNEDADLTVKNCEFYNNFVEKDPTKDGHFLKVGKVKVGSIKYDGCIFDGAGYEGIRVSDTRAAKLEKACDTLIVRNSTFENVDAECIRFYADDDTTNHNDAYVLIENLTVNNSATRVMYISYNRGTTIRNIIVSNSRLSGHNRDSNILIAGLPGSTISHVDTFNMASLQPGSTPIIVSYNDGKGVEKETIWGFDPLYADAANKNYTLLPGSHAYYSGHDGNAIGSLAWATNTPTVVPFNVSVVGEGSVTKSPELYGLCVDGNSQVTLTAVPDSGNSFVAWSGDLTGTENPVTVTADAAKNIIATFEVGTAIDGEESIPVEFALNQNYPNPFNPQTTIPFTLTKTGTVTLKIYDIRGALVETVVNNRLFTAGLNSINWNPANISSGVYFYQLKAEGQTVVKKMHYIR